VHKLLQRSTPRQTALSTARDRNGALYHLSAIFPARPKPHAVPHTPLELLHRGVGPIHLKEALDQQGLALERERARHRLHGRVHVPDLIPHHGAKQLDRGAAPDNRVCIFGCA
jgi:hypothetical protein